MAIRKNVVAAAGKMLRGKKSTKRETEIAAADLAQRTGGKKSSKRK